MNIQNPIQIILMSLALSLFTLQTIAQDTTPPVAKAQPDTIYLDTAGNAVAKAIDIDNGSTDNVGVVSWVLSDSLYDCSDRGSNPVVLTVADAAGNSDTAHTFVVVLDTIPPIAMAKNHSIFLDASGNASLTVNDINDNSFDNCAIEQLYVDKTQFDCTDIGQFLITLTAVDSSGNRDSIQSVVVIEDNIPPVAKARNDTFYLDAFGMVNVNPADLDDGSTDNCTQIQFFLNQAQFSCWDLGTHNLTFTAMDFGGRSNSTTVFVTIMDTTPPVATVKSDTIYLGPGGTVTMLPHNLITSTSDACGIGAIFGSKTHFDCNDVGLSNFFIIVEDSSGNQTTVPAQVVVFDTISPSIICRQDTSYCQDTIGGAVALNFEPLVQDNCSNWTISLSSGVAEGGVFPNGTTTNTYAVKDSSGNTTTCSMDVTVRPGPFFDLGPDTAICAQETMVLSSGLNAGADIHAWQDGSTGSSYTVTQPGTYYLQVNRGNGCAHFDTVVVGSTQLCLGVAESRINSPDIRIYPNPNSGHFKVEAENLIGSTELVVYGMDGQQILVRQFEPDAQLHEEIHLPQVTAGTYLLVLRDQYSTAHFRLSITE